MRDIKFRAWNKTKNVMILPKGSLTKHDNEGAFHFGQYVLQGDSWLMDCDFIIMQFTGLKDKNGKEIWEGDIVRVEDGIQPFEVKWVFEDWDEDGFHTGFHLSYTGDQYEVLGNIYENPELLESK